MVSKNDIFFNDFRRPGVQNKIEIPCGQEQFGMKIKKIVKLGDLERVTI
jgi:hypothetical protein